MLSLCIISVAWLYFHIAVMCSTSSNILLLSHKGVVRLRLLFLILMVCINATPCGIPIIVCWVVVKEHTVLLMRLKAWVWLLLPGLHPFEHDTA